MTQLHKHNLAVCWIRVWAVIGTKHLLRHSKGYMREIASDMHQFELRRFAITCRALETTA